MSERSDLLRATQLVVVELGFEPDPSPRFWVGASCRWYARILSSVGGVEDKKTRSPSLRTLGSLLLHEIDKCAHEGLCT